MAEQTRINGTELAEEFLADFLRHPEGEKLKLCIQCGTCSGSCPTSEFMDYTPRQIIAAVRAGLLDRVLNSNTIWVCSSCYSCTVRCPQGIRLTDAMYELKRLAIKHDLFPRGAKAPVLEEAFMHEVDKYGRNPESAMMTRFYLGTNPLEAVRQAPFALGMLRRGRLKLREKRIRGHAQLEAISRRAEEVD